MRNPREHWFDLIQVHFAWHKTRGDVWSGEYPQHFMDRVTCEMCVSLTAQYKVLCGCKPSTQTLG